MMAAAKSSTRNSRWSRDPVRERGEPVVARITERDIEIFALLARFRYLPGDDIHAFVGGGLKPLIHRLNLLSRSPNLYINRPHQQRESEDANHRRLVYELDEHGSRLLRERGLPFLPKTYHRNFAHELMVCRIMASVELGVRADATLRLIAWSEILASDRTPLPTRMAARPERIPVGFEVNGQTHRTEICADGFPFGIERTQTGNRSYLFFPGIEADCGTEPVESSDIERSSIFKKFVAYRTIAANGIHQSHFGFPNFFVPIITTNRTRMDSMMKLLERITEGRGSKNFLFKTWHAIGSPEQQTATSGHMIAEPWQRVGYPDFRLGEA